MRIGPAANVARLNVAETITALWSFANALGLRTDVINEWTAAAGVTIDGVRLLDRTVSVNDFTSIATLIFRAQVLGEAQPRHTVRADGGTDWGDGTNPVDTNLFRAAPGELATDNHFNVGGTLDLGADIELSERSTLFGAGTFNDVATDIQTCQRITVNAGPLIITGFAGGRVGRVLVILGLGSNTVTLNHDDVGSVAANRMLLPNAAPVVLGVDDGIILWFDNTTSRWRAMGLAN